MFLSFCYVLTTTPTAAASIVYYRRPASYSPYTSICLLISAMYALMASSLDIPFLAFQASCQAPRGGGRSTGLSSDRRLSPVSFPASFHQPVSHLISSLPSHSLGHPATYPFSAAGEIKHARPVHNIHVKVRPSAVRATRGGMARLRKAIHTPIRERAMEGARMRVYPPALW